MLYLLVIDYNQTTIFMPHVVAASVVTEIHWVIQCNLSKKEIANYTGDKFVYNFLDFAIF